MNGEKDNFQEANKRQMHIFNSRTLQYQLSQRINYGLGDVTLVSGPASFSLGSINSRIDLICL